MTSQPFTGLYSEALKDLCASIEPKDLVLFLYLCAFANENGICYPGVKKIAQALDWRHEEVRYRLDRLDRQSLIKYLRRGQRDPYTGEFVADLYQVNPRIYLTKIPVTHAAESAEPVQFRMPPSNLQHNQNQNQIHQPESETRIRNQHQQPDEVFSEGVNRASSASVGNTQTGEKAKGEKPNTQTNANTPQAHPALAGTQPAPAGHAEGNTPPSSAPPPNWKASMRYDHALPDARLEALANELKAIAPTRLYNARELVMTYGEEHIRRALAQLVGAKSKGNVYNPCGLLTSWLRNGSVKAEPAVTPEASRYVTGIYADIIKS